MIYSFDYYDRYEAPELILCNPNDDPIGAVTNYTDLNITMNLSEVSELSYKIYCNDEDLLNEDGSTDTSRPNIYRLHTERRQIHAVGIGYFIIVEVSETISEDGKYKEIECKSCEYELNNIQAPYISNTYILYNDTAYSSVSNAEKFKYYADISTEYVPTESNYYANSDTCLLAEIMGCIPDWSLKNASKFTQTGTVYYALGQSARTFEYSDKTLYTFLKDDLQDAYGCFVDFDIENRQIDILTYEDVMTQLNMVLSNANVLDSCEVSTDSEDYVNSLSVSGGTDDVLISSCNPMGTNVIYNFSYDLESGIMSDNLKNAIIYWQNTYNSYLNGTSAGSIPIAIPSNVYPTSTTFEVDDDGYYHTVSGGSGNTLYEIVNGLDLSMTSWLTKRSEAVDSQTSFTEESPSIKVSYSSGGVKNYTMWEYDETAVSAQNTSGYVQKYGPWSDVASSVSYSKSGLQKLQNMLTSEMDLVSSTKTRFEKLASSFKTQINAILSETIDTGVSYETTNSTITDADLLDALLTYGVSPYGENENNVDYKTLFINLMVSIGMSKDKTDDILNYAGNISASPVIRSTETLCTEAATLRGLISGSSITMTDYLSDFSVWTEKVCDGSTFDKEKYAGELSVLIRLFAEAAYKAAADIKDSHDVTYSRYAVAEIVSSQAELLEDQYSVVQAQIVILTELYNTLLGYCTTVSTALNSIAKYCNFEYNFYQYFRTICDLSDTDALTSARKTYGELIRILRQQSYTNENISITDTMTALEKEAKCQELYDDAVSKLSKLVEPSSTITVEAEPFIFNSDFSSITSQLKVGTAIYVDLPDGTCPRYMLTSIAIDYDEPSCSLEFSNKINAKDPTAVLADLETTAASAASVVASNLISWGVQSERVNELMSEKSADINTTAREMRNSTNNVSMGADGFRCFSLNSNNEEVYGLQAANGVIMFSEVDSSTGETNYKAAVGRMKKSNNTYEYGFYGDSVIANTITADKLAVGSVSGGTNLIKNGSFEAIVGAGSSADIVGWNNAGTASNRSSTSYSGTYALSLSNLGNNNPYQNITGLTESSTYTLSYYCYFNGSGSISCTLTNASSTMASLSASSTEGTGKWIRKSITFTTNNQTSAVLSFAHTGTATILIDCVMLEESAVLHSYSSHINETDAKYTTINDNGISIYGGNISIYDSDNTKSFGTNSGNLFLKGNITTSGGSIAGWDISSDSLTKSYEIDNTAYTIGLFAGDSTIEKNVIYAGTSSNPEFYVTSLGKMHATAGVIGGWTIGASSLTYASDVYYLGLNPPTIDVSSNASDDADKDSVFKVIYAGKSATDPAFYVTANGDLHARNAIISTGAGSSISGSYLDGTASNDFKITDENILNTISKVTIPTLTVNNMCADYISANMADISSLVADNIDTSTLTVSVQDDDRGGFSSDSDYLYSNNTSSSNKIYLRSSVSSSGDYVIDVQNSSGTTVFGVASNGDVTCNSVFAFGDNFVFNSDGFTTKNITGNETAIRIKNYDILWGEWQNNQFVQQHAISLSSVYDWNHTEQSQRALAIAGRSAILFGTRTGGSSFVDRMKLDEHTLCPAADQEWTSDQGTSYNSLCLGLPQRPWGGLYVQGGIYVRNGATENYIDVYSTLQALGSLATISSIGQTYDYS